MDKLIMDEAQFITWIVTMIAAVATASVAISNLRKSIKERKLDLLWKQASAAREFINEMHDNRQSSAAVSMLDWFYVDKFENYETQEISNISYVEVLAALQKICDNSYSPKERYILECFDWFFYYVDRVNQHIDDGLFLYSSVKSIFYPYYVKISENRNIYMDFMRQRNYFLAIKFWERFNAQNYQPASEPV